MLIGKLGQIVDVFIDNDVEVVCSLVRRNIGGGETLRHLGDGGDVNAQATTVWYKRETQSQDKGGCKTKWIYKRPVFAIFHMQRQLHAKESGDAHESSRIWRYPGYCP